QRDASGASRQRMLREIAELLSEIAQEEILVLVLEDLHWGDYSTLDLISYLAGRREPARLLLIGTYRPVEVVLSGHPLRAAKQELQSRGLCQELPLGSITEAALEEYLKWRFPNNQFQPSLAQVVYQRTEGSPLFMVNVLDYAVAEGLIAQVDSR